MAKNPLLRGAGGSVVNPLTTLARIRALHPCPSCWATCLKRLGPDLDAPISLGDIAASNGAADALWAIQALDWHDEAVRRAVIAGAVMPAVERASAHTQDARVHDTIRTLRRWCNGNQIDLIAVCDLAYAAYAAGDTAEDAPAAAARAAYAVAAAATGAADAEDAPLDATLDAIDAAARAAYAASADVTAAATAERARQCADLIAAFPPVRLAPSSGTLQCWETA